MATDDLSSLIPYLRLSIGDITAGSYRYTTEWLTVALVAAVETLSNWWYNRYLVNTSDEVYRNTNVNFEYSEPPVLMIGDERPIVLMAGIILLEGSLENASWNIGSWRDAEIAYSNIESGKIRDRRLQRMWEELENLMVPPSKKLAYAIKGSLPGYKDNLHERNSKY